MFGFGWAISRVAVGAEAMRQDFVGVRLPLGVFERGGGGIGPRGLCGACGDHEVTRDGLRSYIVYKGGKKEMMMMSDEGEACIKWYRGGAR